MAHIYCDESGGAAPREQHFTLAAVAVDDRTAARAVKAFHRAARQTGEIKGSSLSPEHRKLFVRIMVEQGCGHGAAVVCIRGDAVGGWALRTWQQQERILYRHLMAEAFGLLGIGSNIHGITADERRYKRTELQIVASELAVDIKQLAGRAVPFNYANSAVSPGLQIVDVLCNTASKLMLPGSRQHDIAQEALEPLLSRNLITVRPAELPRLKPPAWLRTAEKAV